MGLTIKQYGRPEEYSEFLEACKKFIDSKVETAADERRHDNVSNDADENTLTVTHLAMAISAPDLHRQICYLKECRFPRYSGCVYNFGLATDRMRPRSITQGDLRLNL